MTNLKLPDLERFMTLLHATQKVKRVSRRPGETNSTNTAEHTFELVMLCWYIAGVEKLGLNHEKILKYALAHDLIEAYAGDTPAYDTEGQKTKHERERNAFEKIKAEFPEFPELITTIESYEDRDDEESKFVYAADKLMDPLNCSLEPKSTLWKELDITYSDVRKYKDSKIAQYPLINNYWGLLCEKLEKNLAFYFKE
ncbi:hypothetical protein CO026_02530 [Candidatus Kaiserbacteria bacterium CG_4_9_14_0_2_um_filter_41_32]|uniref:5'-deoxynucleotidase n=1 Tax=Candidatus Kaiserbacteria bacterium CG_4_9_14_0_2_um_filter_41_32 TaxID=1974601 RepID=A0A2M8FEL4_9BACT|nr:MAG: hypothetical protein CO026_02530 [Candidatus Kaiserbacteria bacterium CG_4_9_14_0_2_um_filter_41_32]